MALSKEQLEKFKVILEEMKRQITGQVREANEKVQSPEEGHGYSQHQADEGTDDADRAVELEVSDKELRMLRQIERALEKMDENTYGYCDLTEEEIPLARLEALPYATMTVKAQERLEKGLV